MRNGSSLRAKTPCVHVRNKPNNVAFQRANVRGLCLQISSFHIVKGVNSNCGRTLESKIEFAGASATACRRKTQHRPFYKGLRYHLQRSTLYQRCAATGTHGRRIKEQQQQHLEPGRSNHVGDTRTRGKNSAPWFTPPLPTYYLLLTTLRLTNY